jgi:hypothetical protein
MLASYLDDIRRNHALEHATVSLLITRLGPHIRLVGRSSNDGFFIFGNVPGELVAECAREGLRRLQRGQDYWAVTPLCGTNIATAGILAGLSTMAVVQNTRSDRLSNAMVAGTLAVLLSQPIGRWLQKHVTTSPHLSETEIVSIETKPGSRFHKVRTRRVSA